MTSAIDVPNTHKVTLAVYQVEDLIVSLDARRRARDADEARKANCRQAIEWLKGLVGDKTRIQSVELLARRDILEAVATAAIADGLISVGKEMLAQIAEGD